MGNTHGPRPMPTQPGPERPRPPIYRSKKAWTLVAGCTVAFILLVQAGVIHCDRTPTYIVDVKSSVPATIRVWPTYHNGGMSDPCGGTVNAEHSIPPYQTVADHLTCKMAERVDGAVQSYTVEVSEPWMSSQDEWRHFDWTGADAHVSFTYDGHTLKTATSDC